MTKALIVIELIILASDTAKLQVHIDGSIDSMKSNLPQKL